ncbi:FtsX-like permease family protein [Occultella kanbiaonis]|uniref:FtsX-like permease family protein n=1 Tax=Occultella kanbiaonis TaxID=2675754 RepID=UPI0013D605AF|nr:FtsX-like permease family protein [Occultella kanbiaonis]
MRTVSIGVGAAVATLLVLIALAIPDAVYPPAEGMDAVWRANVTGALLFALTPAVVLLITTSRISSSTRDRRLASLRLIGMDRGRAALVAAVEAGSLTAAGALIGAAAFWGLAPVVDRASAAGPGWFAAPLRLPGGIAVIVVVAVVAIGAAIAAGSAASPRGRAAGALGLGAATPEPVAVGGAGGGRGAAAESRDRGR